MQGKGFSMVVLGNVKTFNDYQELFKESIIGGRLFNLEGKEVFLDNFDENVNVVIEIADVVSYYKERKYFEDVYGIVTIFNLSTRSSSVAVPIVPGIELVLYNNVIVPENNEYHERNLHTPVVYFSSDNLLGTVPDENYTLTDKTRMYVQTLSSLDSSRRGRAVPSLIRRVANKGFWYR